MEAILSSGFFVPQPINAPERLWRAVGERKYKMEPPPPLISFNFVFRRQVTEPFGDKGIYQ